MTRSQGLTPAVRRLGAWSALALLGALGGCATIAEEDCPRVDWYALGADDGRRGYPQARIVEHRDACRRAGVAPDEQRYWAGRQQGLVQYCTLPSAISEGRAGRAYQGVCPPQIDGAFRDLHQAAYAVHEAQQRQRELQSTISSRERELRKDGLSDRERDRLRSEIRDLDRRRENQRDEVYRRERELDRTRRRYGV
ncbi:MAG: DUF2799 domain-containing protein [Burkholderiaceae bacterium]